MNQELAARIESMTNTPQAVLWDFDGTLVNSEVVWVQAEIDLFAEYGVSWTYEQGVEYCGSSRDVSMPAFFAWAESQGKPLPFTQQEFYEKLYSMVRDHIATVDPLPWLPGAEDLVNELADRGIPQAIVSASPIDLVLAGVNRMRDDAFQVVIPGEEMPRGKPAPDGYLLAAERLGVDPKRCVVIEDSLYGTQSGVAAGAAVIAVPCMHPLPIADGQHQLKSLVGVDVHKLGEIMALLQGEK